LLAGAFFISREKSMPVQPYLELSLLLLVTAAAINDLVSRRIPNRLLLVGWLLALPLHALSAAPATALLSSLGGAFVGLVLFLPLYLLRATAAGDVKLMATVGAFADPAAAFETAILTWCVGGLMALVLLLARGRLAVAFANLRELLRPLLWRLAGAPAMPVALPGPSVGDMPYGLAIGVATLAVHWSRYA
jgi:prepilin peptidase CpaA